MPMLTTLRIALARCGPSTRRCERAPRTPAIRSSTAMDAGHDVLAVDDDRRPCGARSATCSTARFSVTLIFSPRNIASMRARSVGFFREREQQAYRLVGDPLLRVIEVDAGGLGRQLLAARRIGGEELPQRASRRAAARAQRGAAMPCAL